MTGYALVASFLDTHSLLAFVGAAGILAAGTAAAIGYYRSKAQDVWRQTAEGWHQENEANKERADRLAAELAHTAAELKTANMRTDITNVLAVLQGQHKEATAILTRIANEAVERADSQATLLKRIADESAERNGHIAETFSKHTIEEAAIWKDVVSILADTRKTVESLRAA